LTGIQRVRESGDPQLGLVDPLRPFQKRQHLAQMARRPQIVVGKVRDEFRVRFADHRIAVGFAVAHALGMADRADTRLLFHDGVEDLERPVGRAVANDHHSHSVKVWARALVIDANSVSAWSNVGQRIRTLLTAPPLAPPRGRRIGRHSPLLNSGRYGRIAPQASRGHLSGTWTPVARQLE
jgi:hypothetical protein